MVKKSLGYVRTEWTCPNCQTRNPGPQKTCASCGMPQPDDVKFEQTAQEEIITNEAEIEKAKAGPDIHCYYCGSRNPAGAATCSQCGADLTEGTARKSGDILGGHRQGPAPKITCSACGAENEANASKCGQCGALLPRAYCERCGMDITSPHVCPPEEEAHVCPPVATMPRRCSKCGEPLPAPVFCEQCGADLTPSHQCAI